MYEEQSSKFCRVLVCLVCCIDMQVHLDNYLCTRMLFEARFCFLSVI